MAWTSSRLLAVTFRLRRLVDVGVWPGTPCMSGLDASRSRRQRNACGRTLRSGRWAHQSRPDEVVQTSRL